MPEPPTPHVVPIAGGDRASHDRRSHLCLPWPPPHLSKPTAPHATVVAIKPGVCRHHLSALGVPWLLAPSPRESRHCSVLGERWSRLLARLVSVSAGCPTECATVARPREPPPPLKPNTWQPGGVFIATQTWCGSIRWHRWARVSSSYLKIQIYKLYIYRIEVMEALGFH
jgi:hypothetical protein